MTLKPGSKILHNGAERTVTEVRTYPGSPVCLVRFGSLQWHRVYPDTETPIDTDADRN